MTPADDGVFTHFLGFAGYRTRRTFSDDDAGTLFRACRSAHGLDGRDLHSVDIARSQGGPVAQAAFSRHPGGSLRFALLGPLVSRPGLRVRQAQNPRVAPGLLPHRTGGARLLFRVGVRLSTAARTRPVLLLDEGLGDGAVHDWPGRLGLRDILDRRGPGHLRRREIKTAFTPADVPRATARLEICDLRGRERLSFSV